MAEVKKVRLSKAAREFNISVQHIVDFLEKKGFTFESVGPNASIGPDEYQLLTKEFHSEKQLKETVDKLNLELSQKKESISIEETQKQKPQEEEEEEIRIKNVGIAKEKPKVSKVSPKAAPKEKEIEIEPKETVAEEPKAEEPKAEEPKAEEPKAEEPKVEEPKAEEPKAEEPKAEEPKAEEPKAEEPKAEEPKAEESEPSIVVAEEKVQPKEENKGGLKIVGNIDLQSISGKTRPDSKKKAKKEKEEKASNAKKEDIAKKEIVAKKEAVAKIHKEVKTEVLKVEAIPVKIEEPKEKPQEENKFIKTEYTKLEGPKMTGQKIDLSQFDKKPKPVASSRDDANTNKKKRKRIKDEGSSAPRPTTGIVPRPDNRSNAGKKDKGKRQAPKVAAPVDSLEIEKQIKETLARLSPMGKSKTSKHRREKRANVNLSMQEEQERLQMEQKILKVTEFVTANELATMMSIPVTKIIGTCMSLGLFVSINQRLTAETISLLAEEYGFEVEFVDAEVLENLEDQEEIVGEASPRPPIVTVMGHVDHGKTSLLDHIRKTNVIAGEAGGITQHIGAYEVRLEDGRKITFLDTPGHEAFTAMRARGAKVTDISIIVISADDRIMPQTREAINHAQAAGVPLIFAINKIDKAGADPERIKKELAEMNLLVEEWGGKYQSQDISAKKGINMDQLLEKVLLEAELLDLKAYPQKRAKGTIIESSLDKGRGYVAKVLIQDGTVRIGDPMLAGTAFGTVKAMYNERNQAIKEAGPSTPVLMIGLNGAPQAGDLFNVTASLKEAKDAATRRIQLQREQGLRTQKHITLDEIGRRIAIGDFKELNIIVKGDVDGSIEALADSLLKLSTPEVQVNVIHKSVGQISESDVLLASASNAIVVGFQVRPSMGARKLAESEQIDIRLYSIIYDAINEIKDAIEGMLSPEIQEKTVCNLEIREVFKIGKVGTIAGCIALDGKINRQTKVRVIRDGIVVYTGKLGSLRRFKDEVKEVVSGQDCGLNIDNFNDIKVGDIVEGYDQTEVKRSL